MWLNCLCAEIFIIANVDGLLLIIRSSGWSTTQGFLMYGDKIGTQHCPLYCGCPLLKGGGTCPVSQKILLHKCNFMNI